MSIVILSTQNGKLHRIQLEIMEQKIWNQVSNPEGVDLNLHEILYKKTISCETNTN